jgi:DNA-binding transcriptional LysR family regulator
MNLTHLPTFAAVADMRHFARAAAACNLSQPAVSHQIALLKGEVAPACSTAPRGESR